MDPFVRRIYLWVAAAAVVLWVGMLALLLHAMKAEALSVASLPAVFPASARASLDFEDSGNTGDVVFVPHSSEIQFSVYHTVPGDNFAALSQKFHLSEAALRSVNQANDGSQPKEGSAVLIPSKDGVYHVMRPGQTLADVARAYGLSLKDVLRANPNSGDWNLEPGDVLFLPGASYLSRGETRWIALDSLALKRGFLKPTTGRFADGFGERLHPISHHMAFHEGLDLAPGRGARVVASQDGSVLFAGWQAGYGRMIILDHGGGLTSRYAHLDQILVKLHQQVQRGELIGKVGSSGRVTGPHLHFEVRLNGKAQNPLLYLVQ